MGAPSNLIGTVLDGRYRLDEELGSGGMGVVYRAHHLALERDVAVKFVRPEFEGEPVVAERFIREAKSASRLDHPNCVRVNDFGETEDGHRYLVMELLRGRELRELVGAPWRPRRAVDLIVQVLEGLAHAHEHGVVHRDLKPANVLITKDHRGEPMAKIVDFGIARMADTPGPKVSTSGTFSGTLATSANFGTPRYMSPEQAAGRPVDARTDVYAAGVILYELLTGHPPFDAADGSEVVRMHLEEEPAPLPHTVPENLRLAVRRMLAKSLDERYGSARLALEALREIYAEIAATPEIVVVEGVGAHTPVGAIAAAARANTPAMPGVAPRVVVPAAKVSDDKDAGASMVGSRTLPPGMAVASPFAGQKPGAESREGADRPSVKFSEGESTLLSVPVGDMADIDAAGAPETIRPGANATARVWVGAAVGFIALAALITVLVTMR